MFQRSDSAREDSRATIGWECKDSIGRVSFYM